MGLMERAQLFGGDVTIKSAPGQGTAIRMVMPRQITPSEFRLGGTSKRPVIAEKV